MNSGGPAGHQDGMGELVATRDPTDARLVAQFLTERSEAAFRLLYRAHTPYLFCLALRLLAGRRDEAEDAVQEAWIRATERLAGFAGRSALRTWLAGIVVNCCRELRRRAAARRETPERASAALETGSAAPGTPIAAAAADLGGAADAALAERLDLERLVAALPDGQREVLVLFDLKGWSHDEIGRRLGIPAGTSKSRLFQARRALRQGLTRRQAAAPRGVRESGDAS